MGKSYQKEVSQFEVEGQFLCFTGKKLSSPKAIKIATAAGEYKIKLSQQLRLELGQHLKSGDWLRVSGQQILDVKRETCKWKAYYVCVLAPDSVALPPLSPPQSKAKKAKILICQKSPCVKRGAKAVQKALEAAVCDRGLQNQVSIQTTGCMNCCKKGPNIVFMPDKCRYQRVNPADIPTLVDKHLKPPADHHRNGSNPSLHTQD